jgi:hypothetical protein
MSIKDYSDSLYDLYSGLLFDEDSEVESLSGVSELEFLKAVHYVQLAVLSLKIVMNMENTDET